jgi:hypothetical protein
VLRLCDPDRRVRPAGPGRIGLEEGIAAARRRTADRVGSRQLMVGHSFRTAVGRRAVVGIEVGSLAGVDEGRRSLQERVSLRKDWGRIGIVGFGRIALEEDSPVEGTDCIGLTL